MLYSYQSHVDLWRFVLIHEALNTLQEIAEEFSHTVMHGAVIRKQLPPGVNRPQPIKSSNVAGLFKRVIL